MTLESKDNDLIPFVLSPTAKTYFFGLLDNKNNKIIFLEDAKRATKGISREFDLSSITKKSLENILTGNVKISNEKAIPLKAKSFSPDSL